MSDHSELKNLLEYVVEYQKNLKTPPDVEKFCRLTELTKPTAVLVMISEVEALRKLDPSKEIIWCACGDGYPVNSYGAGFMDANNGVCANCDAALGHGEQS